MENMEIQKIARKKKAGNSSIDKKSFDKNGPNNLNPFFLLVQVVSSYIVSVQIIVPTSSPHTGWFKMNDLRLLRGGDSRSFGDLYPQALHVFYEPLSNR